MMKVREPYDYPKQSAPTSTTAAIARLRELESAATAAPWSADADGENCFGNYEPTLEPYNAPEHQEENLRRIAKWERIWSTTEDGYVSPVNAELICEVRNALPALLAIAEKAQALKSAHDHVLETLQRGGGIGTDTAMERQQMALRDVWTALSALAGAVGGEKP